MKRDLGTCWWSQIGQHICNKNSGSWVRLENKKYLRNAV